MNLARLALLILAIAAFAACSADADSTRPAPVSGATDQSATGSSADQFLPESSPYRGWDYLVGRLRALGVDEESLARTYKSPSMPLFSFVPFRIRPLESPHIYTGFRKPAKVERGLEFLKKNARSFTRAEKQYHVNRYVIAAILLVETDFGKNTGKETVIYRLSRVASVGDPVNIRMNFEQLQKDDPTVTLEAVKARAAYLERTFTPEICALIQIANENKIDVFNVKGSSAGAFGMPQFLPSSFLAYGVDGNLDGHVSLFNEIDAIFSIARYLGDKGWNDNGTRDQKRAVVYHYNHSDPYVDTVLWLADQMYKASVSSAAKPKTTAVPAPDHVKASKLQQRK